MQKEQQGIENKVIKGDINFSKVEEPRSFPIKFESIKPSLYTSKKGTTEKKNMTARSTKVDTTSILALYGADIDYNGYKMMSSDSILQPRVRFLKKVGLLCFRKEMESSFDIYS